MEAREVLAVLEPVHVQAVGGIRDPCGRQQPVHGTHAHRLAPTHTHASTADREASVGSVPRPDTRVSLWFCRLHRRTSPLGNTGSQVPGITVVSDNGT